MLPDKHDFENERGTMIEENHKGLALQLPLERSMLDNMLLITGVARTGLTWIAAIVATMKYVYRLNHPALFKLIPPHASNDALKTLSPLIRLSLLYDHCVPMVRGIYLCDDPRHLLYKDWAWATCAERLIERRHGNNSDNGAAIVRIIEERPLFISDLVDGFPHMATIRKIFPKVKFMIVVRNGLDVVADYVKLKFATPDGVTHPTLPLLNWFIPETYCPWYVSSEARELWGEWNNITRCAHIWRAQMDTLGDAQYVKYEMIVENPGIIAGMMLSNYPFVSPTALTEMMEDRVKRECEDSMRVVPIKIEDIEQPERDRFTATMENFGYL